MATTAIRSSSSFAPDIRSVLASAYRSAVLASSDVAFRSRVRDTLVGMRWQVREAGGGAEALACLHAAPSEALILDSWLPDLEIEEFVVEFRRLYPLVDLVMADGSSAADAGTRSPRRNELLHALRLGQSGVQNMNAVQDPNRQWNGQGNAQGNRQENGQGNREGAAGSSLLVPVRGAQRASQICLVQAERESCALPEFIGGHRLIENVSRRIRLVAPHNTPVLIQGATGTGKELVARAIHRLSPRAGKPFVAINCAAIPESLLESELFGHARGAFTGAVQRRIGRIEAAQGGTLLLDEIGEMPLLLQAKLLRFVESGEIQRVGDNETVRVDVRILASTHRPLAQLSREGLFRADLYYRLAVFMVSIPVLSAHPEDIGLLVEHFLGRLGGPAKRLSATAMERLEAHSWPGNVRELEHVLERASILAEGRTEIGNEEIEFSDDPESPLVN